MFNQLDIGAMTISFLYVAALVLVAGFAYKRLKWSGESVRKFIHILASCWIFIPAYKMDDLVSMVIGPVIFILVNGLFVYGGFGSILGMGDRKRDNGLVYYPISLLILVVLYSLGYISSNAMISGVLIMGWGDGFAALVGFRWGKHSYVMYKKYRKSIEGTLSMAIVSFAIAIVFGGLSPLNALLVAIFATGLESVTPLGFDNITVPIASALILEALCRL